MKGKPKAGKKQGLAVRTYREVGAAMGISHALVIIIEASALKKIRKALGIE